MSKERQDGLYPFAAVRKLLLPEVEYCDGFLEWPKVDEYAQIFPRAPKKFVLQDDADIKATGGYSQFVSKKGTIPTRKENWHDFYNALSWHLFPRSKLLIQRTHNELASKNVGKNRSPPENGMTLFDECGCVVVTNAEWVRTGIIEHAWTDIFISRREELRKTSRLFTFGHALFERYNAPYIGLTGKSLIVLVDEDKIDLPLRERYDCLDRWIESRVPMLPEELYPLPLLGWPGWWPPNRDPKFYENSWYFRAKRE